MTSIMKNFVEGLLLSLVGKPITDEPLTQSIPEVAPVYPDAVQELS